MSLHRLDATLFLNCDVVVTQPYPKTAIHRSSPLLMTIQPFHSKSLKSGIFVVTGRTGPILRITTTNQEVAGSSPAGPTCFISNFSDFDRQASGFHARLATSLQRAGDRRRHSVNCEVACRGRAALRALAICKRTRRAARANFKEPPRLVKSHRHQQHDAENRRNGRDEDSPQSPAGAARVYRNPSELRVSSV
jgi:hypothetical protein